MCPGVKRAHQTHSVGTREVDTWWGGGGTCYYNHPPVVGDP